jgi:hypothetical protein
MITVGSILLILALVAFLVSAFVPAPAATARAAFSGHFWLSIGLALLTLGWLLTALKVGA